MENNKKIEKSLKYRLYVWSFYSVAIVMKNILATKTFKIGRIQAPTAYVFEPITFIAQALRQRQKDMNQQSQ